MHLKEPFGLSKSVNELLSDLDVYGVSDDYVVGVLYVANDTDREVSNDSRSEAVVKIDADHSSQELLLYFGKGDPVRVADLRKKCPESVLSYDVVVAEEFVEGGTHIRIDTPLIGVGENHDEKQYFVLCEEKG